MKQDKGIPISPKHGVNPTIIKCYFCGESKGIALVGKLPNDEQAPREAVLDYEPCDACQEQMAKGITIVEVTTTPNGNGQPPLTQDDDGNVVYPTGRWVVMQADAVNNGKAGDRFIMLSDEFEELVKDAPEEVSH